jgi:hypothetical protein
MVHYHPAPSSPFSKYRTSIFPTFVEPVKLSLRTIGFVASSRAACRSFVGQTWIAFGGMPASMASLVKARHVNGVSLGGLITTAQPRTKCRGDLSRDHGSRKVPRSDNAIDANRFIHGYDSCMWHGRRNCYSVRAGRLFGKPRHNACCINNLSFGFRVGLAILQAENCGNWWVSSVPVLIFRGWGFLLLSSWLAIMRSNHFRKADPRVTLVVLLKYSR